MNNNDTLRAGQVKIGMTIRFKNGLALTTRSRKFVGGKIFFNNTKLVGAFDQVTFLSY